MWARRTSHARQDRGHRGNQADQLRRRDGLRDFGRGGAGEHVSHACAGRGIGRTRHAPLPVAPVLGPAVRRRLEIQHRVDSRLRVVSFDATFGVGAPVASTYLG